MTKHLIFIIRTGRIDYRMGDQTGYHPCSPEERDSAINYLIRLIQPTSTETKTES